jgi:hypothetical protein
MIKKYLFCCALALATTTLIAQVPNSFNYQSVVRDGFGVLINSQQLGIKVSIVRDSLGGAVEYSETHSASTNANGLFSIQIGEGTAVSGVFDNIQWETGGLFYQIEIDLQGGSNYSLNSFHSFTSVPYAQHAQTADSLVGFSKNSSGHYLGEIYGGGVIFHLWRDQHGTEHGLILDTTLIGTSIPFVNISQSPYPSMSRYDGKSNTLNLVATSVQFQAALACSNSNTGGYTDWYLPSLGEFIFLAENLLMLVKNGSSLPPELLGNYTFWTSSYKWFNFQDYEPQDGNLTYSRTVIAIRQF